MGDEVSYEKTKLNAFVQHLYDQKIAEGKHGHYETMFHVVHEAIKQVEQIIRNEVMEKLAGMELPDPELHDGVTVGKNGKYKSTEDGYTAAQLHQAYAQGAASQLSAEHVAYGWKGKDGYIRDCIAPDTHAVTGGQYDVPLHTIKDAK